MNYSRPIFIFIVSITYFCLFGIVAVLHESYIINNYNTLIDEDTILIHTFLYGLESFERAFIVLFFLTIHRFIFAISIPFLFVSSAVAAYFVYFFKIQITPHIMSAFFEATNNEIASLVNLKLILLCVFAFVLTLFFVWIFLKHDKKDTNRKRNNICVLFTGIFTICAIALPGDAKNTQYPPFDFLKSTYEYTASKYIKVLRTDISTTPATTDEENIVVVLVIGESTRGDHFSLNGYERNTNPSLSKVEHLINFTNAQSCHNLTGISVPCMLTRAIKSNKGPIDTETSLISVYRKLGFKTFWIDNQGLRNTMVLSSISDIIQEAEVAISSHRLSEGMDEKDKHHGDERILPVLDGILESHKGKLLIIIHSTGNHWHYDWTYTLKHKVWTPTCSSSKKDYDSNKEIKCDRDAPFNSCSAADSMALCKRDELINSYDNSILQTDTFLSDVIKRLEERNALFMYSSDHGESLGEDGYYLHGQGSDHFFRPEQFHIPMLIWASEEYRNKNSKKYENIKTTTDKRVEHDVIFHTLLGCSNIETELIKNELNLCSSQVDLPEN